MFIKRPSVIEIERDTFSFSIVSDDPDFDEIMDQLYTQMMGWA